MAKNVFYPIEIVDLTAQKVKVEAPVFVSDEPEPLDLYEGPTADDLRREAEAFKESWTGEKERLVQEAHDEAEGIRKTAEKTAFEEVKSKTDSAIRDKRIAEDESDRIKGEAESEAERIKQQAVDERDRVFEEARSTGYGEGREEGWKEGRAEAERLIERLHKILDAAIEKRQEVIDEAETQLIDLVLLVSRKVVKVISENQKNVVINNIVQALRKLKSRGDVAIRVNLADLDLTTEHIKDFMRMAENVKSITVLEDSSVDKGGAVIETDFGQIDARISSQLREIEEKILELVPIRTTGEG
jgi:flagellar assembly protein FliH